jgi:hypothetical protein
MNSTAFEFALEDESYRGRERPSVSVGERVRGGSTAPVIDLVDVIRNHHSCERWPYK